MSRSFTVPAPIDDVFDFLSNFENTEQWDPGTVSTRRIDGDGGLGTKYANTSEFMGRTVDLVYETITYERPRFFQCEGRNDKSTATDSMTFTAEPDGTRIDYRAEFEFHGWLKLVAPLFVKPKLGALADETVEQIQAAFTRP